MRIASTVPLTEQQKNELRSVAQSRSLPAGYVFRAKLILLLSEGLSFSVIRKRLGTSTPTIIRWKKRFLESGVDGLIPLPSEKWIDSAGEGLVNVVVNLGSQ